MAKRLLSHEAQLTASTGSLPYHALAEWSQASPGQQLDADVAQAEDQHALAGQRLPERRPDAAAGHRRRHLADGNRRVQCKVSNV